MQVRTAAVLAIVVLTLGAALYATRLDVAPIYMMHDETQFALQAQSIAATGRDLSGRVMPVFFTEPEFPAGRDPVIIYATALVLRVLPLTEGSARLATALVGALDILLMFLVCRKVFSSNVSGVIGAALIALTPSHFIRARLGLSPLYSIPFVLLWLLTLADDDVRPSPRRLALAGAWLGLGVYTYLACMIMMPLYLAATCLWAARPLNMRGLIAPVIGFIAVLLPMLAWYVVHPERWSQILGGYREFSQARDLSLVDSLQARMALYWSFFNPEFLFMTGDTSLINSTRQVGFYPLAFVVLIPLGLYSIWRSGRPVLRVIGVGFLTAPAASIISGAVEMNRLMYAIPFGVLVAAAGAFALMKGGGWRRLGAVALLASIPWQFVVFRADYFGAYRERSAPWFGGNFRGALAVILTQPRGSSAPVYISARIPFAGRYWRFNAISHDREDLLDTPIYYTDPPTDAPPGSMLICQTSTQECAQLSVSRQWTHVAVAREPDQTPSFDVLVRQPAR